MSLKRMVLQIGMGTDIRGTDYTKAAVRALRDALWHNGLSVADAVGLPVQAKQVEVTICVPRPERVDRQEFLAVLPLGTGTVRVVEGRFRFYTFEDGRIGAFTLNENNGQQVLQLRTNDQAIQAEMTRK